MNQYSQMQTNNLLGDVGNTGEVSSWVNRDMSSGVPSPVAADIPHASALNDIPGMQESKTEWGTYSIGAIEDDAGFEALRSEWDELLKLSPVNSLFLTWKWLRTWWQHLSEDRKLHIIIVRRANELIAIAPLCLRQGRLGYFLPICTFEFLGVGYVGSDYPDLIIRPADEQLAVQALMAYLVKHRSIIEFSHVLSDSRYMAAFSTLIQQQGWIVARKSTHVCPYINLSGHSWDSYLGSLGSSHRYNFRRRLKNLQKDFSDVQFELIRSEQQVPPAISKLIELHNHRWDERGGSSAFHRASLLNFHGDISRLAFREDCLRLYVLRLRGNVAAILYGFKYNNIFYYYQSGFDTELSRYSVGMVIMGLAIKSAIEEGIEKYDFLHGDEEYKYLWSSEQSALEQFIFIPPGIKGVIYRQVKILRNFAKALLRQYLPGPVIKWITSRK